MQAKTELSITVAGSSNPLVSQSIAEYVQTANLALRTAETTYCGTMKQEFVSGGSSQSFITVDFVK